MNIGMKTFIRGMHTYIHVYVYKLFIVRIRINAIRIIATELVATSRGKGKHTSIRKTSHEFEFQNGVREVDTCGA